MVRLSFLFKVFRSKDYALLPFCLFQLKYGQYPFMVGWPHSERLYHVVFCLLCHSLVFNIVPRGPTMNTSFSFTLFAGR